MRGGRRWGRGGGRGGTEKKGEVEDTQGEVSADCSYTNMPHAHTDRQTDTQTQIQTDRQTHTHAYTHTPHVQHIQHTHTYSPHLADTSQVAGDILHSNRVFKPQPVALALHTSPIDEDASVCCETCTISWELDSTDFKGWDPWQPL